DEDVLAEVLQGRLRAEPGAEVPYLVGPLLESDVVRHAPLDRDGVVLCASRRLPAGRRVTSLAVLDDLGGALEAADLADARDVPAIPLHPELEVLVRVETLGVDGELSHVVLAMP